jgi:hypothetical protein
MVGLGFKLNFPFAQGAFCPSALFDFLFKLGVNFCQFGGPLFNQLF